MKRGAVNEEGAKQAPAVPIGVYAIIATVVIANLGNNIIAPVMPAIRDQFGSTAAQVSLIASGFGLGRLLMDLPAGYLTDRIASTRMFAIGILVSGGAAALAATSSSLDLLIFFRTGMGCGSAIVSTVALVMLVAIAQPRQRGTVLAYFTSAMLFGQAISPTIGGFLATWFDWRAPFLFCAVTPFISFPLNLLVTARLAGGTPASHHAIEKHGHRASMKGASASLVEKPNWAALFTVYLSTFVNFFSRHGMRASLLPLYGAMVLGLDPGQLGAILTTGAVATIVINLPSGRLADRLGKKTFLIPGLLILAVGDLLLLGADSTAVFVLSTVMVSMGVLANSMQSGLVADLVPERMVGNGMGMYRFTADLGVVLGPAVLGAALDAFGFGPAAALACGVVLVGATAGAILIPGKKVS